MPSPVSDSTSAPKQVPWIFRPLCWLIGPPTYEEYKDGATSENIRKYCKKQREMFSTESGSKFLKLLAGIFENRNPLEAGGILASLIGLGSLLCSKVLKNEWLVNAVSSIYKWCGIILGSVGIAGLLTGAIGGSITCGRTEKSRDQSSSVPPEAEGESSLDSDDF